MRSHRLLVHEYPDTLFHREDSYSIIRALLIPAGTFFIPYRVMGNYDFSFPCNFLIGMCDPAGPCLFVFRLYFQSKPGTIHTDNPDSCGGIELNCDQKLCVQSGNTDNKDRNHGYLDEPGRCTAQDRFRPGVGSCVHVRICLLYTSPSPRDGLLSRMPSSA